MKKIYLFICNIYNFFFTIVDRTLYKNHSIKNTSELNLLGFETIKAKKNYNLNIPEKVFKVNPYMSKDIIKKKDILDLVNFYLINNDLKRIITKKTGFKYSIDYFISYTTYKIPDQELDKEIYANQWHTDKPFSKDTLKIIIPLNFQNYYNGGIKIFNLSQSRLIKKNNSLLLSEKSFEMENKMGQVLLFYPNLCYHKAGNPEFEGGRKQIMLQLNPSNKWCLNQNIYQKQFKIEPKFPFFNYLLDKKNLI